MINLKNLLKKNQIIIFTIALMLIVAGYMNYTANTEKQLEVAELIDSEQYAELGDATLVSSGALVENENLESELVENENIEQSTTLETAAETKNTDDSYFTQSKLDRETMYSQMIESYQKILNNNQISEEQRNIAGEEIKNINNTKNAIMIAENLIKNKGFEDLIIFINDKSVNVVVKADKLEQEQIAQIQNIIQRELKAEIEDIHISSK